MRHFFAAAALASALFTTSLSASDIPESSTGASREEVGVELTGSQLPDMLGLEVSNLALFRYDAGADAFVPIPFQVDERIDRVFNQGFELEFTERMYDVSGLDDGLFDAIDEIVFLFEDAGLRAGAATAWPSGSASLRYEIELNDPLPSTANPQRWVYLFSGESLPRSTDTYVDWDLSQVGNISSDRFTLEFEDRWLMTGLSIDAPCGSGLDLLDRVKARAGVAPHQGETEELWNPTSVFLGGKLGPVRGIRYVRGAASGFNTVHHDVVYRAHWERVVNLRVHPLNSIWMYLDWLPDANMTLFSADRTAGVAMDGLPDGATYAPLTGWDLLRGPGGGLVVQYDIPPSPLVGAIEHYRLDDSAYDDAPQFPQVYGDDDDSAWANHGIRLNSVNGDEVETVPIRISMWPLCANIGDGQTGTDFQTMADTPLQITALSQSAASTPAAVRSLSVGLSGMDVVLDWQPVTAADTYRIYRSYFPDLPRSSWTLVGEVSVTTFTDAGAAVGPDTYYSIVPVNPLGEGDW